MHYSFKHSYLSDRGKLERWLTIKTFSSYFQRCLGFQVDDARGRCLCRTNKAHGLNYQRIAEAKTTRLVRSDAVFAWGLLGVMGIRGTAGSPARIGKSCLTALALI